MNQIKSYIYLTGGLGNQFFQLAAGVYVSSSNELNMEWGIGKPRLNVLGEPELASFILPEGAKLIPRKEANWLVSKTTGFVLRQGVSPRRYEGIPGFKLSTRLIARIITSFYFRRNLTLKVGEGVGWCDIKEDRRNALLIGYFQTYRWLENSRVKSAMKGLKLKVESEELLDYAKLALSERPLIVHLRLGDYKEEDSFGIPDQVYYANAIETLWKTGRFQKIWIFSDEPELAAQILVLNSSDNIRWIPEISNSSSQTLELMRHGQGYVIGNSTFSWWGAMLSYTLDAPVIAPEPWFRKMESPVDILPPNWVRLPAWRIDR